VVRLTPRGELPTADPAALLGFVSLAFQHKRRTPRRNLSEASGREGLSALPEGGLRAEQVRLNALLELHRMLRSMGRRRSQSWCKNSPNKGGNRQILQSR